jgi:transcriptional regulator with XRE-family HTH domain
MSNERLRVALSRAELSVERAARETGVDPKTVQRWLAGRIPHPRHRWALAERLEEDEEFLWPNARRHEASPAENAAELVAVYPYRSELDQHRWWDLFTRAERQIDLLGFTLYFLWQQHPGLRDVLLQKAAAGCQLRVAVADPESAHVTWRDREEAQAITIVARIHSSLAALEPLIGMEAVDVRFQEAPLYNSMFRFDDEMLVTPHLYATPGHEAPLLHLRRLGPTGLFSRFATHFEGIWADGARSGQGHAPGRLRRTSWDESTTTTTRKRHPPTRSFPPRRQS